MHCGATPRTLDALRDTLEKREQAAALNAVASAVDVRRGQVDDADLLARAAAGEPAPEPPPAGLSPSNGEVPRREGAGRTTILYDRSHVSSMRVIQVRLPGARREIQTGEVDATSGLVAIGASARRLATPSQPSTRSSVD